MALPVAESGTLNRHHPSSWIEASGGRFCDRLGRVVRATRSMVRAAASASWPSWPAPGTPDAAVRHGLHLRSREEVIGRRRGSYFIHDRLSQTFH